MKKRYPQVISACCFLFLFVNVGLPSTSFSVYQPYLVALPGIGDIGGSLILSLRTLVTLMAMFFVNHYYNRLNCRVGVTFGCALTGLGFLLYSQASMLAGFLLGAVCVGLGYGLGGLVGMTLLTGRWYKSRVGTAVGFATVGSGCAGIIIPPIVLHFIEGMSLSAAFLFEAILSFAVAALVAVLVCNYPHEIGIRPFGEDEDVPSETQRASKSAKTKSAAPQKQPLSNGLRILLVAAMACVGIICIGALAYLSILMTTSGFSSAFSAAMLSVFGVALTISKFAAGELFDRIGTVKGTTIVFVFALAGVALCCLMPLHVWPLALLAVACFGIGTSCGSVGISVWSLELSSEVNRVKTVKDFQVGYAIGGFLGDTFPGFVADLCGSYVPAYYLIFATTLFAMVTIIYAYHKLGGK